MCVGPEEEAQRCKGKGQREEEKECLRTRHMIRAAVYWGRLLLYPCEHCLHILIGSRSPGFREVFPSATWSCQTLAGTTIALPLCCKLQVKTTCFPDLFLHCLHGTQHLSEFKRMIKCTFHRRLSHEIILWTCTVKSWEGKAGGPERNPQAPTWLH